MRSNWVKVYLIARKYNIKARGFSAEEVKDFLLRNGKLDPKDKWVLKRLEQ